MRAFLLNVDESPSHVNLKHWLFSFQFPFQVCQKKTTNFHMYDNSNCIYQFLYAGAVCWGLWNFFRQRNGSEVYQFCQKWAHLMWWHPYKSEESRKWQNVSGLLCSWAISLSGQIFLRKCFNMELLMLMRSWCVCTSEKFLFLECNILLVRCFSFLCHSFTFYWLKICPDLLCWWSLCELVWYGLDFVSVTENVCEVIHCYFWNGKFRNKA